MSPLIIYLPYIRSSLLHHLVSLLISRVMAPHFILTQSGILSAADKILSVSAGAGEQLCLSKGTAGLVVARSRAPDRRMIGEMDE